MTPLISPAELAGRLDEVVVCDIRWSLADPEHGHETYLRGHVPGAVFVDLDTDLAAPPGPAGRHPLPSTHDFAATLGSLGIGSDDEVVVYDDMANTVSARLWWMLRSIGHNAVKVLDGGYQSWVASGGAVETAEIDRPPRTYPTPARFMGVVDHQDLWSHVIVDARAAARYRGDFEPVDPKAGHIPGAINMPTSGNLDESGRFLGSDALADRFRPLVKERVAVSCGSGVNACHNALAMLIAGLEMPDVYVGSFSEWSRLDMPVVTGESP
ncbi:MAG: sulfurtransferase [Acidimicrobiia bacterium]